MEYLLEFGLTKEDITNIKEKVDNDLTVFFEKEKEKVISIISYLKEVGLKKIKDIFIYFPELFFMTQDELKEDFEKYNKEELVDFLNQDIMYLEKLGFKN